MRLGRPVSLADSGIMSFRGTDSTGVVPVSLAFHCHSLLLPPSFSLSSLTSPLHQRFPRSDRIIRLKPRHGHQVFLLESRVLFHHTSVRIVIRIIHDAEGYVLHSPISKSSGFRIEQDSTQDKDTPLLPILPRDSLARARSISSRSSATVPSASPVH